MIRKTNDVFFWGAGDLPRFTQPVIIEDFSTSANSLGVR